MPDKLEKYKSKRDFRQTSKPADNLTGGHENPMFVVQKHDARRLHYDFRLEHDGVLLSWAVPKGPSLDPRVKRLAVHVEDHPLSYGTFEGEIPEGNYGAGTVLVWDIGTWRPKENVEKMLATGQLKFELFGKRLHGHWALIRIESHRDEDEKADNWLLIKEKDHEASDSVDLETQFTDSALAESALNPESFRPQLAVLGRTVPSGKDWIHEVKFDGYRILAWRLKDRIRLLTRNGHDWTDRFPAIAKTLKDVLPSGTTIDGEIVVYDEAGASRFGRLQNWLKNGGPDSPSLVAFDLVVWEGDDITSLPLLDRKGRLARLIESLPASAKRLVKYSEHLESNGKAFFENACRLGLEGILSKRASGHYVQTRSDQWIKSKCANEDEFVIGGFTAGEGTRAKLGAILVGQFDEAGELVYNGKVGSGFDSGDVDNLSKRLTRMQTNRNPFRKRATSFPRRCLWVEPQIVVQIRYAERTEGGVLRHPVFVGVREDKDIHDMKPKVESETKPLGNTFAGVKISHPDRVLFPGDEITKAELAAFYEAIAERLLPYVAERALSVVRCPEGPMGDCFFQKHVTQGMPKALGRKIADEEEPVIAVKSAKDLVQIVQFGGIEIHPWGSKLKTLEWPDMLTFDLDPGPDVAWRTVVEASLALGERLRSLGLTPFVKTSGGKGFHVVVSIKTKSIGWPELKAFAKAVAEDLDRLVPGHFVTKMAKSQRKGRIFLDYLRNGRGATSVAPFVVRAREHAPISVPIHWNEIEHLTDAKSVTLRTAEAWFNDHPEDPWAKFDENPAEISASMRREVGIAPGD